MRIFNLLIIYAVLFFFPNVVFGQKTYINTKSDEYEIVAEPYCDLNLLSKNLKVSKYNPFVRLCPFWQLQIYYSQVLGLTDFYAQVMEKIRNADWNSDKNMSAGEHQIAFIKYCCDVAKKI